MLITHEILEEKCRKAMGGKIPRDARERWGTFLKTRALRFCFDARWIVDNRIFQWCYENKDFVDISGNGDWFTIEILEPLDK